LSAELTKKHSFRLFFSV